MKKLNYISLLSKYKIELMGLAALFVAIFHCYEFSINYINQYIGFLLRRLNIGVDIFIILSGIGVFFSLANDSNKISFYRKRFLRSILPTIILSTIYFFIRNTIFDTKNTITQCAYRISGLSFWFDGDRVIWFVAFIALLYIISPILYNLTKNHESLLTLRICAILSVIINFCLCYYQFDFYQKTEIAIARLLSFVLGCYFGNILVTIPQNNNESVKEYKDITFTINLGLCFLLLSIITPKPIRTTLYRIGSVSSATLISILFCYLIDKFKFNYIKSILKFFGNISLEFYLMLVFIRYIWIDMHINNNLINAALLFALSTLLAYIYKIIYNLFINYLQRKTG